MGCSIWAYRSTNVNYIVQQQQTAQSIDELASMLHIYGICYMPIKYTTESKSFNSYHCGFNRIIDTLLKFDRQLTDSIWFSIVYPINM